MSTAIVPRAGSRDPCGSVPVDVLEQFARGDIDAFESLFRQHQAEVYRWIVRLVRNPGVAEELTVETFWRTWRHRHRFDTKRPFGAWARRIANKIISMRPKPRINGRSRSTSN